MSNKIFCPKCSGTANCIYHARTAGTATGLIAGGTSVVGSILRGVRAGGSFGPVGAIAGSVLSLLFGISSGGFIGAQAGRLIDENVIGLYKCPKCNLRFKV